MIIIIINENIFRREIKIKIKVIAKKKKKM